ncbi:MAG: hypothetical protein V5A20_06440 [Salinibacter sp.]|uniref:hypothetical protein n=1 Tax=Salinibacter sp. TaxID=2065818 RepID=UPI002FC2E43C
MSDPQFDVERATAGLVLALFLAASLLVGAMYYFVLRDIGERADASDSSQAARVEHPSAMPLASAPVPASEHHA